MLLMTSYKLKPFKSGKLGLASLVSMNELDKTSAYLTPLEQFKVGTFARRSWHYHGRKILPSDVTTNSKFDIEHLPAVGGRANCGKGVAPNLWLSRWIICFIFSTILALAYTVSKKGKVGILTPTLLNFINFYTLNLTIGIVKSTVNIKRHPLSLIFMFHFVLLFILAGNLVGMLPGAFAVTAQLVITLWMSLSLFLGNNIIGIVWNEEKFFRLFLPLTSPVIITFLIVPIEYISYFSRIFSLAIRLFANMMSGHVLLKILISFVFTGASANIGHWLWIWIPAIVVFLVIGLELVIAFLQAFVFVLLSLIYLNEAINIE